MWLRGSTIARLMHSNLRTQYINRPVVKDELGVVAAGFSCGKDEHAAICCCGTEDIPALHCCTPGSSKHGHRAER